jgi:AraC-like DNA-binding protein
MEIRFAQPAHALRRIVSVYFQYRADYAIVEDYERADVGYLRFILSGSGSYFFADGRREPSYPLLLTGPGTAAAHYSMNGPVLAFGCVLLPEFWAAVVNASADDYADRSTNAETLLGPTAMACHRRLSHHLSVTDMAAIVDDWLIRLVKPVHADIRAFTDKMWGWLMQDPIPPVDALYAGMELSPRQVMRLSNRYFGAPPKLLARKHRALATASLIVGGNGQVTDEMVSRYADRSHLTREVRHFTGMTPRQLVVHSNPAMRAALQPIGQRRDVGGA